MTERATAAAFPASFKGKKNIYTCVACGSHIVTVDADEGTTPFMVGCTVPGCEGHMRSSMYRIFDQGMRAYWEWHKPTAIEALSNAERAHVDQGGLLMRHIDGGRI